MYVVTMSVPGNLKFDGVAAAAVVPQNRADPNQNPDVPSYVFNQTVKDDVLAAFAIPYAKEVLDNIRFLKPEEYKTKSKREVARLIGVKEEQERELEDWIEKGDIIDPKGDREIFQHNWRHALNPNICLNSSCGKPYYRYDEQFKCITVPVVLLYGEAGNRMQCFGCALASIQKVRLSLEKIEPRRDAVDNKFLLPHAPGGKRHGMAYEIALLRVAEQQSQAWRFACRGELARFGKSIGECLSRDDGIMDDKTEQVAAYFMVTMESVRGFVQPLLNLARPTALMGAHWFWNSLDIWFALCNKPGKYQNDAMNFDANRLAERIMEAWVYDDEKLWDGAMHILRGNGSNDMELIQKLQRAITNNPPITLTGHQEKLREHWDAKMDATMGEYWRTGPFSQYRTKYSVHPDMRPSIIALRLLEINPGCLQKLFDATQDAVNEENRPQLSLYVNHVDPWHVLNDRYFQFITLALFNYIETSATDLMRTTALGEGARSGGVYIKMKK
jgi:hypothetical protein